MSSVRARFGVGLCSEEDAGLLEQVVPSVGRDDPELETRACAALAELLRGAGFRPRKS